MKWTCLFSWLRAKRRPLLGHFNVVMYTRHGCHLCEAAWELLQRERGRYHFRLEARDIDAEPELAALYGEWVPVVSVNGKVRFRGGVNPILLARYLEAETAKGG